MLNFLKQLQRKVINCLSRTKPRFASCLLPFVIPLLSFSQIQFSEISEAVGINHHYLSFNEIGGGAAFFDMDNDGDEDLWISGGMNRDVLYENDGNGYFTEIGIAAGLKITERFVTTGVVTGDFDRDGYRDVLLTTHIGHANVLLKNNGNKTFRNVSNKARIHTAGTYNLSASLADINKDGLLDIYFTDYIKENKLYYSNANRDTVSGFAHSCYENRLYINKGDFEFEEATATYGLEDIGCGLAALFTDVDEDQDFDLLIANDFGAWIKPNSLFKNQFPKDTFTEKSIESGMDVAIYGMGIAAGDFDNDMDQDYYITNIGPNPLLQNQGDGTFRDVAEELGVADSFAPDTLYTVGWGTAFFDADNDADLDLYVVNGFVPAAPFIKNGPAIPNRLFENDGTGQFQSIPFSRQTDSPERGRGLACADIDGDGDLDFLVLNVNRQATPDTIQKVQLFRNESPTENNWFKIKLQGKSSNLDAYGAMVKIKYGGRWYMQEANGGFGTHASQHSSILHFGLGQETTIDSLVISWPKGTKDFFAAIPGNQLITIEENNTISQSFSIFNNANIDLKISPNPFKETTLISYSLAKKTPHSILIFDQMGRKIYEKTALTVAKGEYQYAWQSPGAGLYFLQIKGPGFSVFKKLISNY